MCRSYKPTEPTETMELYVVARQLAIVPKMTNRLIVLLLCGVHMDSELTIVSSSMLVFRH